MAEVSGSHRRPIWDSGPRSRFAGFLRSAARKITITSAGAILLTVIVVPYLYREVTRDVLLIEPFNVPRQYAEMGLTGEVMANHVSDSLDEIEKDAITKEKRVGLRPDKFVLPGDLPATIDVEVPGTKLGLKTIVEIIREVLNIQPTRVRGDGSPGSSGRRARIDNRANFGVSPRASATSQHADERPFRRSATGGRSDSSRCESISTRGLSG
jgi:hypothetical protein